MTFSRDHPIVERADQFKNDYIWVSGWFVCLSAKLLKNTDDCMLAKFLERVGFGTKDRLFLDDLDLDSETINLFSASLTLRNLTA